MIRWMPKIYWLLVLTFLVLSCSKTTNRKEPAEPAHVIQIKGRLYLAGTDFHAFVAITDSAGHSFVLIGADSLKMYQDYLAVVTGRLPRPGSDSILVSQVKLLMK